MVLLARILAPQLLALLVYFVVRLAARRRDPAIAQLAAIVVAGASAWWAAISQLTMIRAGAFVALEIFVSLLVQLLILAAQSE